MPHVQYQFLLFCALGINLMPLAVQTNPTYLILMLPFAWKCQPSVWYDKKDIRISVRVVCFKIAQTERY
jgi:hypothetical protein